MKKLILAIAAALSVLSCQAQETILNHPSVKAIQTGSEIALYQAGEEQPFAVMENVNPSEVKLTLEKRENGFIGIRVAANVQPNALVKSIALPVIKLASCYKPSEMKALGSAGLAAIDGHPGSYMYLAAANPTNNKGVVCGWISSDYASGIVFSSVNSESGAIEIKGKLEYSGQGVPQSSTGEGEVFVIGAFDDCRLGLEGYGDEIAAYYDIKLPAQPVGYLTWYDNRHPRAGSEVSAREFVSAASEKLKPWGFTFYQIDDGWQDGIASNGPARNFTTHKASGPFPSGMKATADFVKSRGLTAGIWLIASAGTHNDPFYADKQNLFVKKNDGTPYAAAWGGTCFDFTNPDACRYVYNQVHRISNDWGYKFFKFDGLWTAIPCKQCYPQDAYKPDDLGNVVYQDPTQAPIAVFRKALKLYRQAAGDDCFFLGCCIAQNMRSMGAAYGLVDAMRVGPDNCGPKGFTEGPLRATARYFLNGRVWYNDPDSVYVRDSISLDRAIQCTTWTAISGQLFLFGDWLPDLSQQRVDILRRTMSPHGKYAFARPMDLFENRIAQIWKLQDRDYLVLGLFNWDDKQSLEISKTFAQLDLIESAQYTGFDFWNDTFIPPFEKNLIQSLAPGSCKAISLRKWENKPVLVSTNRHVVSPILEVENETWNADKNELSGVSLLVGNDPYELRIVIPNNLKVNACKASAVNSEKALDVQFVQKGNTLRVQFASEESEKIA